jgi:carbon-monoxide dehydrogenase medium subunit
VKPAAFKYHDPRTVAEVVDLLGHLENNKLLAGGQSLGPMLNFRYVMPDHLIDLNRVPALDFLHVSEGRVEIGAMTRQRTLERSVELRRVCPIFADALHWVGHFQTRNRGTIGGSLSHLDPSAELPGICALYDASLIVQGPSGMREVPMADWGDGYMTATLAPDELLASISLPAWHKAHGWAFLEMARRHGDFAMAGAACLMSLNANGTIARVALVLLGIQYAPVRLREAEELLIGQTPNEELFKAAAARATQVEASDDAHVSSGYRKRLAGVLTGRVLHIATERAKGEMNV